MAEVVFTINFKEDLKNHTTIPFGSTIDGNTQADYLPKDLAKLYVHKSQAQFNKIANDYLTKYYQKNGKFLRLAVKQAEEAWKLVEKQFFKRLEKITGKKVCTNKFVANLTTLRRCPYSFTDKDFMFSYKSPAVGTVNTCAHEIMHIQIINSYKDKLPDGPWNTGRLPSEFAWHLMESLNFLIDEEFSNILPFKDIGRPIHQDIRKALAKEWRKNKDFDKFLPKAIAITRRMIKPK